MELRKRRNGWSKLAIQCNSTQNHTKFFFFMAKIFCQCLGLFLASYELIKHIIGDMHKSKFQKNIILFVYVCTLKQKILESP